MFHVKGAPLGLRRIVADACAGTFPYVKASVLVPSNGISNSFLRAVSPRKFTA
jgi:hypothetical protein